MLEKHCVRGITANASKMEENVKNSLGLVTALSPSIGYSTAVELALEASRTGRNVYDIALETGLLARDELDQLLNIANMINPNR